MNREKRDRTYEYFEGIIVANENVCVQLLRSLGM